MRYSSLKPVTVVMQQVIFGNQMQQCPMHQLVANKATVRQGCGEGDVRTSAVPIALRFVAVAVLAVIAQRLVSRASERQTYLVVQVLL